MKDAFATTPELTTGDLINASGHKQELERNFSLFSLCAVAINWKHLGSYWRQRCEFL